MDGISVERRTAATLRGRGKRVVMAAQTPEGNEHTASVELAKADAYRLDRWRTARFLEMLGPASYQRRRVSSLLPVIDATVR